MLLYILSQRLLWVPSESRPPESLSERESPERLDGRAASCLYPALERLLRMKIQASVQNSEGANRVTLRTNEHTHSITIAPRPSGFGSSVNGGELLFLDLATCYCNDVYREAERRGISVQRVEVDVEGDFEAEGWPARNVTYRARVTARAAEEQIRDLMRHTDRVAEIQNTLRVETPVTLIDLEEQALQPDPSDAASGSTPPRPPRHTRSKDADSADHASGR